MINVLFVCHGNICRSPLGEFILKDMVEKRGLQDKVRVESCGTSGEHLGDPVDRRSAAELAKHGISCAGKRSRKLAVSDFTDFDYILAMDKENYDNIVRACPDPSKCNIHMLLDYAGGGVVDDPYFTLDFGKAYSDVERGCIGVLRDIEKRLDQ